MLKFNSQNPNGIKREVNQIQGNWRRLKLQSKKEHDLQSREARKTSGGKALTDVKVIRKKKAIITKKEDGQEYSNFRTPPKKCLLHNTFF